MITVPASIEKSDIETTVALHGKANSRSITLNGITYAPGEVQFLTFAGGLNTRTRLYEGVYRFALCKTDEPQADLNQLPTKGPRNGD